jgi:hypothetical protein
MTEEEIGNFALEETRRNERTRERQMKESREEAVRMEEEQQRRGKADKNKPILRH